MNVSILLANVLTLLAFLVHTFVGDREVRSLEPESGSGKLLNLRATWTMVRNGWHWVSVDLLLATVALALINFTDYFSAELLVLEVLVLCFFSYGAVWILSILISKPFPNRFLKLGQWLLLWLIAGLIYLGIS